MSEDLNVISSLIIMHNLAHLVRTATDDCKLQQQHHGEHTCSCCAICQNLGSNDFTLGPNKRIAKCNICGIKIKDAGSTTSNFIRHLKTHLDRSVTW